MKILPQKLEQSVLNEIRTYSFVEFWKDSIVIHFNENEFASLGGLPKSEPLELERRIHALDGCSKDFKTFTLSVNSTERWRLPGVIVRVKDGFEWDDVIREAWGYAEHHNPHYLTDNALRLWEWAKSAKNTGAAINRSTLGRSATLRGSDSYYHIPSYLIEIQRKADPSLHFEHSDRHSTSGAQVKVWFSSETGPTLKAENPQLEINIQKFQFCDLERVRTWLYQRILSGQFSGPHECLVMYGIKTRSELKRCFPGFQCHDCWPSSVFDHFLEAMNLVDGIALHYCTENDQPWLIWCEPEDGWTWDRIKALLIEKQKEVPPEKKYDLSPDAMALLKWIMSVRKADYTGKLTPLVENVYKTKIGLTSEWDEHNIAAHVQMLIDEINENTDYALRIQPWRHFNKDMTRISVGKKILDVEQVVKQIQMFALQRNRLMDASVIRGWLGQIVGPEEVKV